MPAETTSYYFTEPPTRKDNKALCIVELDLLTCESGEFLATFAATITNARRVFTALHCKSCVSD